MMPPSPRGVSRLAYGPAQSPGVVHLGLGAFHRAHQAIVFDDLLRSGDTRWGIAAFGMQSDRVSAVLADADGWFPVSTNAPPHVWRWVGSIWETGVVSANRAQAVEAIAAGIKGAGKDDPAKLVYGQSITDACLGWDASVQLLEVLDDAVRARRT